MTEKDEFLRGLEDLGEAEVRSRVAAGTRSPYQRRHMDWAKEWIEKKDSQRAEAKDTAAAANADATLNAQKEANRLNGYIVWISIGLLFAAITALYLGK